MTIDESRRRLLHAVYYAGSRDPNEAQRLTDAIEEYVNARLAVFREELHGGVAEPGLLRSS